MPWIWDWVKYYNSHSSKSIRVTKLFFCQNGVLLGRPFWQKDSVVTLILFELWILWYLVQFQILVTSLYLGRTKSLENASKGWLNSSLHSGEHNAAGLFFLFCHFSLYLLLFCRLFIMSIHKIRIFPVFLSYYKMVINYWRKEFQGTVWY